MATPTKISIADVCSGDLLLFDRPSLIQWFGERAGDPFRGVALAEWVGDELLMHQCGRRGGMSTCRVLDISHRYNTIAVLKMPRCGCSPSVIEWAKQAMSRPSHYPSSVIVPAFFLSLARQRASGSDRRSLAWPILATFRLLARVIAMLNRSPQTFICSTYVHAAWSNCGHQHFKVDLARPKPAAPAAELPAVHNHPGGRNADLARWFLTPSDLWRALPPQRRHLLGEVPLRRPSDRTGCAFVTRLSKDRAATGLEGRATI